MALRGADAIKKNFRTVVLRLNVSPYLASRATGAMDDDGMLFNFSVSDTAVAAPQTKFKGGNWKDRQLAKKRSKQSGPPGGQKELRVEPNEERPTKRPRISRYGMEKPKPASTEVVSSLFTYNPHAPRPEHQIEAAKNDGAEAEADVKPSNAPLDDELSTFTSLGLSPTLASHLLKKMEIKAPTAIQRKAIQELAGKNTDAFIQAETGSGKTLAYLLPIVQQLLHLSKQVKAAGEEFSRHSGLFAIILAPTRELSKQISVVLENLLSCCHWLVSGTVIGGEKKKSEKARLRKGLNILVATPGRLADHLDNTEVLDVSKVRWLVLDEGDRLMELGFEKDIQRLVSVLNLRSRKKDERPLPGLPSKRSNFLCSATIRAQVDDLATVALKDPVSIAVDPEEEEASSGAEMAKEIAFLAPAQLKQSFAIVPPKQRLVALVAALKQAFKRKGSVMKCIVFMSCADSVDFHFEILSRSSDSKSQKPHDGQPENGKAPPTPLSRSAKIPQGTTISETRTQGPATSISSLDLPVTIFRLHGSLQQTTRTSTLKAFTKCSDPAVLVCTDVASRGLDLPNVDLVIEYDPPFSKDDHLHRIGRTARAGKDGRAMIFLMPGSEEGYVDFLKEGGRGRNVARHDSEELLKKAFSPPLRSSATTETRAPKSWEDLATDFQLDVERWALAHPSHLEQARRAFQSHVRAYATHVAAERSVFDLKQLHLGHLAKAFALRDKPGSIRVPGSRPGDGAGKKKGSAAERKRTSGTAMAKGKGNAMEDVDDSAAVDEREAKRKMRMAMKAMGGASEFNLG